jgi:hypothetical protein
MLFAHTEFTTDRSPLAFVSPKPSALRSPTTSVISAWHGSQRPTEKPASPVTARVRMVELPVFGLLREQPVAAVVVRGQVRPAIPEHARPLERAHCVMPCRHVLDRHAVGLDDVDADVALERAVQDHAVAIRPADGEERRRDDDGLGIDAG